LGGFFANLSCCFSPGFSGLELGNFNKLTRGKAQMKRRKHKMLNFLRRENNLPISIEIQNHSKRLACAPINRLTDFSSIMMEVTFFKPAVVRITWNPGLPL
jgi:hypothetical protein